MKTILALLLSITFFTTKATTETSSISGSWQGKDASEMQQDFTATSRERIVSCSKWLSAALVMTFVDEGKLSLEDTVGKYLPIMTLMEKAI